MKKPKMSRMSKILGILAIALVVMVTFAGCNVVGAGIGGGIGVIVYFILGKAASGYFPAFAIGFAFGGGILTFIGIRIAEEIGYMKIHNEVKQEKEAKEAENRAWATENEKLKQSAQQGDVEASYQLAKRYHSKGEIDEAKKWFRMATDKGHKNAESILSDIEKEQKVKEDAAKEARKKEIEEQILERTEHVHYNRGVDYLRQENWAMAKEEFYKAMMLDPNNTDARDGYTTLSVAQNH